MIRGAVGYVDHWAHLLFILHVSSHLNASAKVRIHEESSLARGLGSHSDTRRPGRTLTKPGTRMRVSPLLQTT